MTQCECGVVECHHYHHIITIVTWSAVCRCHGMDQVIWPQLVLVGAVDYNWQVNEEQRKGELKQLKHVFSLSFSFLGHTSNCTLP